MASIFLRGKVYWILYYKDGKKISHSLKTKDKKVAKYRKNEIENQISHDDGFSTFLTHFPKDALKDFNWIEQRWHKLNFKEKQAVIYVVFKGRCFYCDREVTLPEASQRHVVKPTRLVLDHRVAFAYGGSDNFSNTIASCQKCNSSKSDGKFEDFLMKMKANSSIKQDT